MGPYVWCVMGAVLGWLAASIGGNSGFTERIEAVAVGVFGAFLGGEFMPTVVLSHDALNRGVLNPTIVAMAFGGALGCLLLLRWMRHAVGPLLAGKKKRGTT